MLKYLGAVLPVSFVLSFAVGVASCDSVDAAFDCQAVCDKYKGCYKADYDVGACRTRCRDKASNDKEWEAKADVCADCIEGKSCTGATFSCGTECAGIVP